MSAFNKVPQFMVGLNDSLLNRSCLCDMCCLLESRNMLLKTCEEINGCTACIRVHSRRDLVMEFRHTIIDLP